VELLPVWEEFCRYRDTAKLADDELMKTAGDQQQQRTRRSVKPAATKPQAKDKHKPHAKVIYTLLVLSYRYHHHRGHCNCHFIILIIIT